MTEGRPTRPDPEQLDRGTPAYYRALGDGCYQPTIHTQGAWNDWEQHMAPVGGLLTHAIARHEPRPDMQVARLTFEILGLIPASEVCVHVRTLRPGRTIELVEATLLAGERALIRGTAWRLSVQDTAHVAGTFAEPMPRFEDEPELDPTELWPGGYIASLQMRGDRPEPGRGHAWLSTPYALVDGEDVGPLAALVGLVDTANGIATRESPREWMFPNVDLTIHLFRQPVGRRLGLDTTVSFGPQGLGLTSSTLHDEQGPFGAAEQILTVRPMP